MIAIDWKPEARTLRWFGVCTGFLLALLGLWVFFRHALLGISFRPAVSQYIGVGLWIAGAVLFLLAITFPRLLWPIYIGMNIIAFPIGMVVSHFILFAIFYLVFTPLGLLFRLIGRDALHRKLDPAATTYWIDHDPQPPARLYFRQF